MTQHIYYTWPNWVGIWVGRAIQHATRPHYNNHPDELEEWSHIAGNYFVQVVCYLVGLVSRTCGTDEPYDELAALMDHFIFQMILMEVPLYQYNATSIIPSSFL